MIGCCEAAIFFSFFAVLLVSPPSLHPWGGGEWAGRWRVSSRRGGGRSGGGGRRRLNDDETASRRSIRHTRTHWHTLAESVACRTRGTWTHHSCTSRTFISALFYFCHFSGLSIVFCVLLLAIFTFRAERREISEGLTGWLTLGLDWTFLLFLGAAH